MITIKSHKRKSKNRVSIVKQHARKAGKKNNFGFGKYYAEYKQPGLKGVDVGGDGVLTYDHLTKHKDEDKAYKVMIGHAKSDSKKLKKKKVKHKLMSGKTGNDIGIPYILKH